MGERRRLYILGEERCRGELRGALEVRFGLAASAPTHLSIYCPDAIDGPRLPPASCGWGTDRGGGAGGKGYSEDWVVIVLDPADPESSATLIRLYRHIRALVCFPFPFQLCM